MNTPKNTQVTLWILSQMPFLDSLELSDVGHLRGRTTREALRRLREDGCIEAVPYTRPEGSRQMRYCLTPTGVEMLAGLQRNGKTPDELILSHDLLSAQGRRYLLRRMHAVAALYRIAQDVSVSFRADSGSHLKWRWERQGAVDAVVQLPAGRTVAISRIGSTHSGEAIRSRLRTLGNMHERQDIRTTLLLVPEMMDIERPLNYMYSRGVEGVFVASEDEMLSSPLKSEIWRSPDGGLFTLRAALVKIPTSEMPSIKRPTERLTMPSATLAADTTDLDRVASTLTIPARRLLRLLYDWPFVRISQLRMMLGISDGHLRRVKGQLSQARLVHHLQIGHTIKERLDNETRLVLSASAVRYLSRVDRSSEPLMRSSWLVEPHESGDETFSVPHFRVVGKKARTLLRERSHTDGVYAFLSLLVVSCRSSRTWTFRQALPAHRWERRYRYGTRRSRRFRDVWRAVRPDASFVLKHPDRHVSFALEYERRARNPSKMDPKLEQYRTYFASADTSRDFIDGRPTVLFVFETREGAGNFTSYASSDGGEPFPLLVSSLEDLRDAGSVFRTIWLAPWHLDRGPLPLTTI